MLVDARDVADGRRLTADVCIIGAGPAGLTVADGLRGSGRSVIVLESGGESWEADTQSLAAGELAGLPFRFNGQPVTVEDTRLRQLGGSSNHWTGMCRPLDPHDLTERAAIAGSGWPISADELARYQARAAASCELATPEFDAGWWSEQAGAPVLAETPGVRTAVFQISPPTRFGERLRPALAAATDVEVHLWANVVELVSSTGSRVDAVRVATLTGRSYEVHAGTVVLATGGIDVPRLLLASRPMAGGLANSSGLVGRCFMEHPHLTAGRVVLAVPGEAWRLYAIGPQSVGERTELVWAALSPTPTAQADAGIGNGAVLLWPDGQGPPRGARDDEVVAPEAVRRLVTTEPGGGSAAVMTVRGEQEPDPDSRVLLGEQRDRLGVPRPVVDWRLTDTDRRTLRRTVEIVGAALGAAGLGRVEVDPSGRALDQWPVEIGNHHMGTARMHADPTRGVVDATCRAHDVENLYVAGSAVFPTSGMANPTFTIVALAHRLADHLAERAPG